MTILEYIKHWEGFVSKPYLCPAGKLTIGYGRNIQDRQLSAREYRILFPNKTISEAMIALDRDGISEKSATMLLKIDVDAIIYQLNSERWTGELSKLRFMVIVDMAYNMGYYGLLGFKKMIKAIKEEDYEKASDEIRDSKYYKQVGRRAKANYYIMRLDVLPLDLCG